MNVCGASPSWLFLVVAVLAAVPPAHGQPEAAPVRVDWLDKAYGDGAHNAFTDLIRWRDAYYLCFRHGASHGSMDGEIRVMRSPDLRTWAPCGTLETMGDDRDPHFTATPDRLYVYFGVWDLQHSSDDAPTDRGSIRSHVAWTEDGKTWSKIHAIYEPGWWVWRVKYQDGMFYGIAYSAYRPTPPEREIRLLTSEEGLRWTLYTTIATEQQPSESDMWFEADGSMNAVTRMTHPSNLAFWYRSDSTRKAWTGASVDAIIHSPAVAQWRDRIFVVGRGKSDRGWVTRLWELVDGKAIELLTLPSSGDTGYPGLLTDPASLEEGQPPSFFISWYSQHEQSSEPNHTRDTASIYVARVSLQK